MTSTLQPSLQRSRDVVRPALQAAARLMDPVSAAQTSYHLAWTDADGNPTNAAGGKSVRSTLALLSARCAGAPESVGMPGAVAVELVHNFSLLHDDVMDGDRERRHRRTVWALWGVPSAILTGDAMLTAAQRVLIDGGGPHALEALRLLLDATQHLIRGQVMDVEFERRESVTLRECQDMAAGKTGALLSASASIGAVLAGADAELVDALSRYGSHVGAAFQLVDDLLGIWGDPETTGKPVLSDLRARKKTLPIAYALTRGGQAGRELAVWLADTPADGRATDGEPELRRVADLIEAGGGRRWAAREAQRRLRQAEQALLDTPMPDEPREELFDLARFVVSRDM